MRRWPAIVASLALGVLAAGCGKTKAQFDAAPAAADARVDAGIGAGPPGSELTSGGGRVSGGTLTLDVQIGHPFAQGPATGGGLSIEGDTAIKP